MLLRALEAVNAESRPGPHESETFRRGGCHRNGLQGLL